MESKNRRCNLKDYQDFLAQKANVADTAGFEVEDDWLNPMLYPFQRDIVKWACRRGKAAVFADCGLGKGQPYGSKVLTPSGWSNIEQLRIGSRVISSDGKPYPVRGVYQKRTQDTYRFHFSDKTSLVVDSDHLHITRTNNERQRKKPWRVMSTQELLDCGNIRYGKGGKSRNYDIPVVKPVAFDRRCQTYLDPWLMGVLLGDGCICSHTPVVTNGDEDLIDMLRQRLPDGYTTHRKTGSDYDWAICWKDNTKSPMKNHLKRIGLWGKRSHEKFIPPEYMFRPVNDRIELLRGLLDTDAYIKDTTQYYTTSKRLADGVMFLIRSLGGIPTISKKKTHYTKDNGERVPCKDCYTLTFSMKGFNPFHLPRRAKLWNPNPRDNGRWIDRIEFEKRQETVCIAVDSPDHSYVTEHFIVTHNTPVQLEWAKQIIDHDGSTVLLIAPLAVSRQTIREGKKFGIPVNDTRSRHGEPHIEKHAINITNYQQLRKFNREDFGAIVLDESSILKGFGRKYRQELTDFAKDIPYRLACTATPAPNDYIELTNHAEFLGIMSGKEVIALYFTNDGNTTHAWRLKRHAQSDFWKWLASWSVALRSPMDLGYRDDRFNLPELRLHEIAIPATDSGDYLFPVEAVTMDERRKARRTSINDRVLKAAEIANATDEQVLIWCDLNAESTAITKAVNGSVEVKGSDSDDHKENSMLAFQEGSIRVLVTKPKIAGHGMNWQNCCKMIFVGLSDSWEAYYQAVRRCWRFGQTKPVDVSIVIVETEGRVLENIRRKEKQADGMMNEIIKNMGERHLNQEGAKKEEYNYMTDKREGPGWVAYKGDAVEMIRKVETESVGLSVFSPPFPGMYAYTNSMRDMGNVKTMKEMIDQYRFLVPELLRVLKPGRTCAVHLCQGVAFKGVDGYIGIKDFRGEVIRAMEDNGFIYYGEVCIDKDPQVKAIRTKDAGLLFKSLARDSARMHMALADYVLQFRKPGDNVEPIHAGISKTYDNMDGWITQEEWISWAAPVWMRQTPDYPGGIKETDVLNKREGKDKDDEKHICPLQLGVIERCVKLWSNPQDIVFSPFGGIGSEGYTAIKFGRQACSIELKDSYFDVLCKNMQRAIYDKEQPDLLDLVAQCE